MFRIVRDPSSWSIELYLTDIIRSGSQTLSCACTVFGSVIFNQWCVCTVRRTVHTHTTG